MPSLHQLLTGFAFAASKGTLCATCLSRRVGVSVYTVRRAFVDLHATARVAITSALCAGCGQRARVLIAQGESSPSSACQRDEALSDRRSEVGEDRPAA
jgi:hypothetical protein